MSERLEWTRTRVRIAIRELHARGKPLTWTHAPRKLLKAAESYYGSWRAAVEAVGIDYDAIKLIRVWTDDELVDWLRGLARKRPEMTLEQLSETGRLNTLKQHFGSWRDAVARAGLVGWPRMQKTPWTRKAVIARLRELYGQGLTANQDTKAYQAAIRHFGSLSAAAAAAGVTLRLGRTWSKREVVETLRAIERKHGKVSSAHLYETRSRTAVVKHFGGLEAACKALGLRCDATDLAREHAVQDDRDAMLARLRRLADKMSHPVTALDMPHGLRAALLRHFKTLEDARAAAGVPDPAPAKKWNLKRVLAELRREHRRGTRLTYPALIAAGRRDLLHAIDKHAKPIARARRLAGVPEPKPLPRTNHAFVKEWDADRVIDEILDEAAAGRPLASTKAPKPLVSAGIRYWGSWREAIEAAGFDYNSVALHRAFDDGELLAILRRLAADHPEMTATELQHQPIATSLHRRYGGYENAVKLAGITDWPIRVHLPRMGRAQARTLLRARVAGGKSIDRAAVAEEDQPLAYAVTRVHPDWSEALARLALRSSNGRGRDRTARPRSAGRR